MRAGISVVIAALAYFASARLGYFLAIPGGLVTLWPPAGIMLGLLVSNSRRSWPWFLTGGFIGSVASDLISNYSPSLALAAAAANNLESLAAAWIITRRLGQPVRLASLRAVLEFIIAAAIVSNAATALLGALMLNVGFRMSLASAWFVWWVGDGLGMLIVAPVLIGWAQLKELRRRLTPALALEGILLVLTLFVIATLTLGPERGWRMQPGAYSAFPLLFWASLRFGSIGAATGALIVAGIATTYASLGVGPFAGTGATSVSVALDVYTYLVVASLSSLVPGAVLEDRRAAEQRLRESEERYRTVVDAANDAIITIDDHSHIRFANPAAVRIFGYDPHELIGAELTMLMPEELRDRHRAALRRYLETGQKRIEWRGVSLPGLRKDAQRIALEVSFGELAGNGQHVFTGVLRDVSEKLAAEAALREAESRMRFAMEASRVGTWEIDYTTEQVRWSEMLEELHGLSRGSFGGTLDAFHEHIHPDDRESVRGELERAMRQRTDATLLYRTVWPNKSVHWITGVGRTFYDVDGAPIRAAGIGFDVTERRLLEEQYRQSQKMEAIGHLAGGVAHDFNNLLTAIQGFGTLLLDSLEPSDVRRSDVAEILRAADHAASLTRQLLAFSRRQVLAPQTLNLAEAVRAMLPMLRRLIGEDITVRLLTPGSAPVVNADPGQVEQVVLNLALNARDAMPNGGSMLIEVMRMTLEESYVERHVELKPGIYAMLAMTDTGVGMNAQTLEHAFEPFFTTKPLGKGTGLGLSTVYGIIRQSGGNILVYSEPGRGTTFKVYLPLAEWEQPSATPAATAAPTGGSETVLIAEDNASIRTVAQRVLEKHGYRVLVAASPNEALAIAAQHAAPIDLLLADVVLPEMSGRALAEQLVAQRPGIRVLYMSGYTDDAVVQRGVLEEVMQFIQKPFGTDALLRKVRGVLDQNVA